MLRRIFNFVHEKNIFCLCQFFMMPVPSAPDWFCGCWEQRSCGMNHDPPFSSLLWHVCFMFVTNLYLHGIWTGQVIDTLLQTSQHRVSNTKRSGPIFATKSTQKRLTFSKETLTFLLQEQILLSEASFLLLGSILDWKTIWPKECQEICLAQPENRTPCCSDNLLEDLVGISGVEGRKFYKY